MKLRKSYQLPVAAVFLLALGAGEALAVTSVTRTSAFEYDATTGLLTKEIIEPDNAQYRLETLYTIDSFGNRTQATVSSPATGTAAIATRSSSTGYDTQGRFATSASNALSQSETRVFDTRFGGMTSLTGPNALATTWTYDAFGRKTLETRADGTKTKVEYLFCSGVNGGTATCVLTLAKYVVVTTPLGADGVTQIGPWSKVYFDVLNREIRSETQGFATGSTTPPLICVDTVYESKGRVDKKSRPFFCTDGTAQWTTFTYDDIGRVLTETHPDTTSSSFAYNGLTTTATNELGQIRTKVRNSQGQIISTTEGKTGILTATTAFEYDPFGNLTKTTDANGNVTVLTYDLRGRKISMADPDMGTWTYVYDVLGQLKQQIDAKSQVTTMAYDLLGRMTGRTETGLVSTWTYDTATKGIGKLASASADNGYSRVHTYDTLGRPSSTAITVATGVATYTTSVGYDTLGRIETINYPSGTFGVKHVYTSLGYLQEVQKNGTPSTFYWRAETMNAERQLSTFRHGNNVVTTRTYEASTGRLTAIQAGTGNAVQNMSFTYDAVSNLLTRSDATQSLSESFTYDPLNRLTQAQVAGGATKTFTYDAGGNLLTKSDVGTYTYPTQGVSVVRPHAVQSIAGTVNTSFTYDANGNMLTGNNRTTTWTSFNMVATVTRGTSTLTFSYDPEHGRTRQVAPDGTTLYLAAFGIQVERFNGASTGQWNNYVYVGGEIVAVFYDKDTGTDLTRFFHKDHLGSIAVITDEAGAVAQRLSYDAWGKRRNVNGTDDTTGTLETTAQTDRGFTGHEHLQEVALIHMNGRIYDPQIGRFMSADPFIQDAMKTQGYNRYTYVDNNPLCYTDPSGYFKFSKIFKNPIVRTVVAVAAAAIIGPAVSTWIISSAVASAASTAAAAGVLIGEAGIAAAAAGAATTAGIVGGAAGGFAAGFITSGSLEGAAKGAFISTLTFGVGEITGHGELPFLKDAHIENIAGHAAVGCLQGSLQGGNCGSGALSAGFGAFIGPLVPSSFGVTEKLLVHAVVGGTTSVIGGGKFENGAITAAFGYLFNEAGDCFRRGYCTNNDRTNRNIESLHPNIRPDVTAFVNELYASGVDVVITDGYRTNAQQSAIPSANTRAGAGQSYHNFGLAFDMYYSGPSGANMTIPLSPAVGALGVSYGFEWGGNFRVCTHIGY
jgi:RHS repeat-associated protein